MNPTLSPSGLVARAGWAVAASSCAAILSACPAVDDGRCGDDGSFSMLTYNVAGLPQGLNDDQFPERNIPQISPLLNTYDLVVVQEDFSYTNELRQEITHPFESAPHVHEERFVNDGLNRFSVFSFPRFLTRVRWVTCFGGVDNASDCLANKGFSVAVHEVGCHLIPVVNLHAEAGGQPEDIAARREGIDQLITYIGDELQGGPLIVAGDFNLHGFDDDDEPDLQRLMEGAGLDDACRSLDCGDEHIDRILFRSGGDVALTAESWRVADEFIDGDRAPLSDHDAIHVDVAYRPASDGE